MHDDRHDDTAREVAEDRTGDRDGAPVGKRDVRYGNIIGTQRDLSEGGEPDPLEHDGDFRPAVPERDDENRESADRDDDRGDGAKH